MRNKGVGFLERVSRGQPNSQTYFECQGEDAIRKLVDDFNAKLQASDIAAKSSQDPYLTYGNSMVDAAARAG